MRRREAQAAARVLDAHWHRSLVNDLEILYELKTLRRLAALIRDIRPALILTHSPEDYMEDHTNACRLTVTAAFSRGMPNFRTTPPRLATDFDTAIYHAMPHGLQDGLRRRIQPDLFVNTTRVHDLKLKALACHASQQDWLDTSQGMNSYTTAMDTLSRQVGRMSRRFTHAEGWRRHSYLGFSTTDSDPLSTALHSLVKRATLKP
jgi:LmbE family N-acetylglucosaminyl deacetylase